jgi:hypothetical protein
MVLDDTAELLTLFLHQSIAAPGGALQEEEVPLVSVVRDTLGRADPSVHRLRYVWAHTYTRPSFRQRMASAVPFFAGRFGNSPLLSDGVPPEVLDLSNPNGPLWQSVRELALKTLPLYPKPPLVESVVRTYRINQSRYRNSQLARASAVLDLYDRTSHDGPGLSGSETLELQSRLSQARKFLSQFLDPEELQRMYLNEMNAMRIACGRNWENLRQRAEAEGLYFEPLLLPDGTATHALLWVASEDLARHQHRAFNGRFLNIENPWNDASLRSWKGITETWYFDKENRRVEPGPSARAVELIPLALYGLDYPKIPTLLVDFRKALNPKRRELSRRATDLAADHLVPVSFLTNLGRRAAGFITRRKGIDLLQSSRVNSYSELKTLLAVNSELRLAMREEIGRRIELIADNPLENDVAVEAQVARNQYNALVAYATQPDGLLARLRKDRREELAATHAGTTDVLFKMGKLATLGIYTHREANQQDLPTLLEGQRLTASHERFVRAVIASGSRIEITWDMEKVRNSLEYLRTTPAIPQSETAQLALQVFTRTLDDETKRLCLDMIHHLQKPIALQALQRLLKDPNVDGAWRTRAVQYLNDLGRDSSKVAIMAVESATGAN